MTFPIYNWIKLSLALASPMGIVLFFHWTLNRRIRLEERRQKNLHRSVVSDPSGTAA